MDRACDGIQKKLLIKMNFLFALVFDPAEREPLLQSSDCARRQRQK